MFKLSKNSRPVGVGRGLAAAVAPALRLTRNGGFRSAFGRGERVPCAVSVCGRRLVVRWGLGALARVQITECTMLALYGTLLSLALQ